MKNHVSKELSAYCQAELGADEARCVAEHLLTCQRCREEYEQIKLAVTLVGQLPGVSAPAAMWQKIESAWQSERAGEQESESRPVSFSHLLGPLPLALAAVLLLALGLTLWYATNSPANSWEVMSLAGAPKVGSDHIGETGWLAVGDWLETDDASRAQINVGRIGQVEIEPNTRVRLLEADSTDHRLALARGRLHASIWAPPRLFFVETPSAVAVDLGCAYTLQVNDQGAGLLHVTSGWVALELAGRESIVSAGAMCETRPGIGPGTPYFPDAPEAFRGALARFDFEDGGSEALSVVLAQARRRDTITLWHLIARVDERQRNQVVDRLAALVAPPEGVTRDGVLRLDQPMLDLWWQEIESTWSSDAVPGWRKTWRKMWDKKRRQ